MVTKLTIQLEVNLLGCPTVRVLDLVLVDTPRIKTQPMNWNPQLHC